MLVCVVVVMQVISGKKRPVGRRTSLGLPGLAEEDEWEGPVRGGGGGGGMVRVEERSDLAAEIGSVVTGLTEFKAELLQLHAIVSIVSPSPTPHTTHPTAF